jgi:hypothetical protein
MCLKSAPCHVHVYYVVSAAREAEVLVLLSLYNSCDHVTEVGIPRVLGLTLAAVMQNDEDFVTVV